MNQILENFNINRMCNELFSCSLNYYQWLCLLFGYHWFVFFKPSRNFILATYLFSDLGNSWSKVFNVSFNPLKNEKSYRCNLGNKIINVLESCACIKQETIKWSIHVKRLKHIEGKLPVVEKIEAFDIKQQNLEEAKIKQLKIFRKY